MSRAFSPLEFTSGTRTRVERMDTSSRSSDPGHEMDLQRQLIDMKDVLADLERECALRDDALWEYSGPSDEAEYARDLIRKIEHCSGSLREMSELLEEANAFAGEVERSLRGEPEPEDYGFDGEWPSEMDIAIATWNLQGSDSGGTPSPEKLERLVELVMEHRLDLVHLQELTLRGGEGADDFLARAAQMLHEAGAGNFRYASLNSKRSPFHFDPAEHEGVPQGDGLDVMPSGSADAYGWLYNSDTLQLSGAPQLLQYEHDDSIREALTRETGSRRRRRTVLDHDVARHDLAQRVPAIAEFETQFASFTTANWHAPHNGQADANGETPDARNAVQMYGASSYFATASHQQHIVAGDLNVSADTASRLGRDGAHGRLDHIVSTSGPVIGGSIPVRESDHDPVVGTTTIQPNLYGRYA